jgi:hypothetical protein
LFLTPTTSSARERIDGGTVGPSALAVLRLTTSSKMGLLDQQIGGLGALEDLSGVNAVLANGGGGRGSVHS